MPEQERERLLGYLLNALDEQEAAQVKEELASQPHLRAELATLQQEIAPLNYMADPVEPPPHLANRTCAKIWKVMDNENNEEEKKQETPPQMDSVLGFVFDPFKTVVAIPIADLELPKLKRQTESPKPKPPKSKLSYWVGWGVSVSLGIVAAFFLFPMIRFAERSTRSYVTDSWMTEIHQRVDQYEQIYSSPGGARVEEVLPYNLAQSGWQEITIIDSNGQFFPSAPPLYDIFKMLTGNEISAAQEGSHEIIRGQQPVLLPGFASWSEPIPLDTSGIPNHIILSLPGQEPSVRSAFGQDILIRDGRVFFRILPGTESPKK